MSAIFGIFSRNGKPVNLSMLESMQQAMSCWGGDGQNIKISGQVAMGQIHAVTTPEAVHERLPYVDTESGLSITFAGRIDNRDELGKALGIHAAELLTLPDSEIVLRTYCKWGEDSPGRIYGDWSFAVWNPKAQRLFLSRDHFGNTSLYYYIDQDIFAFATSRKALLSLNLAQIEMDELYLAQVIVSWHAYHGERSVHSPLRRLPPAHSISVSPEVSSVRQYWFLENTPITTLKKRSDYIEVFLEKYEEAVRARLRVPDGARIASTLSGGLDSSSVTAVSARQLSEKNIRLNAFTSVPLYASNSFEGAFFGDELPFARATVEHSGNINHHLITAEFITPLQSIRRILEIIDEPAHAAGNFFWILDLEQTLQREGYKVLLSGQMGNAGISWTGDIFSQPLSYQLRRLGVQRWLNFSVRRKAPLFLIDCWRKIRNNEQIFSGNSAINQEFARRISLHALRKTDPAESPRRTTYELREFIMTGRSMFGALNAEMAAAHGLEMRDPTADIRLLSFAFSVPDHVFMDTETGDNRWLMREGMKGLLPDKVRLNRKIGRQACDLVPRLRASAHEIEAAFHELSSGPSAAYLDIIYMKKVWEMIQGNDSPEAYVKAVTVLTRGIMAGLFVNRFYGYGNE